MTKEELEKYAHENRKRLDAQEVKIGDVVKVLRGQFAGETGVVVGIIACIGDYTDPYYEVDMDCEVPDKYKCRKNTLAQPNNVIGGLSAYDFEVIGNRAPMQSTEEVKVGDKVRVSKDAPKLLFTRSICNYPEYVFEVRVIEDDLADIFYGAGKIPLAAFVVPTKYLIKVDAEAKEPKFKVGDVVRMKDGYYKEGLCGCIGVIRKIAGCHIYVEIDSTICPATIHSIEPYTEPTAPTIKVGDFVRVLENLHEPICLDVERHLEITNMPPHAVSQKEWKVISVEMRRDCAGRIYTLKHDDSFIYNIPEDCVELVQPKEQTEAEKKPNIGSIKIPVEVDLTDSYWTAYTADLAKEIALKVANKHMDCNPEEIGAYAVSVAKAVVENLNKK